MISVLEYLELSAKRFPGKTAAADPEEKVSFKGLLESAERIGSALAAHISAGNPVPVYLPKGVKAVEVFMGAVCAGCFYSMLDKKQPEARLASILDTLDAKVLVTDYENAEKVRTFFNGKILTFEELSSVSADRLLLERIRSGALDTDPLYVNFTSGSTGTPKGVAVSHRSVIDFIDCFTEIMKIGPDDVIGNQAPFDFDVSVKDLYSALKTGASMQIIPQKYFSIPTQLLDYLVDNSVTTLIWAVSALTLLSKMHGFTYKIPEKVKRVIFSGEVMPVKHLRIWREALPEAEFYNVYGPTEITCNCTWYRIEGEPDAGEAIPIGKPFPNERVFLLDEDDHPVECPGREGEICVAGTALALGYYRNPEATSSAFVQNPLNDRYPERIYRTGDLAKYLEDGNLVFTGRKDFQIKHMGHRIELGEIELAAGAVPQVITCCCLFLKERIILFYTGDIEKKELAAKLKEKIPDYMVPNTFVTMEQLPINKNGKTDRKALAELWMTKHSGK